MSHMVFCVNEAHKNLKENDVLLRDSIGSSSGKDIRVMDISYGSSKQHLFPNDSFEAATSSKKSNIYQP
jgi:hypothetical protein